jgi:hypothetical protein
MTVAGDGPRFSVREVPFSVFGSWLDLSCVIGERTVAQDVHLVSHQTGFHPVLKLVATIAGQRVAAQVDGTPSRLRWQHGDAWMEASFESPDTLRLTGRDLDLTVLAADGVLTPFTGPYFFLDPVSRAYVFTTYETGLRYRITVLRGTVTASGMQALGAAQRGLVVGADPGPRPPAAGADRDRDNAPDCLLGGVGLGAWEVAVEEVGTAHPSYLSDEAFEEVRARAAASFTQFLDAVAPWRDAQSPAADLAAYVLWSATVHPEGALSRTSVLMSKHWMDKVWSWDHCFNAIALVGLPTLAWDQFQVPFDHQEQSGALPDSVTHSEVLRNFVKPPIHGWALRLLRERAGDPDRDRLEDLYRALSRWTRFWLDYRRAPGSGLAHYQHGNDSGWDNATTFDPERVVESADLAAFLVLQLDELGRLATDLGRPAEAAEWVAAAGTMLAELGDKLWDGDRFLARGSLSGRTWTSSSLLDLMPIILGERLDRAIADRLAARIEKHLTDHGPATEMPGSPEYQADGYWRGPIWAPATVLIEDGLRGAGHSDLANRISVRFRRLCEASGFAENFDAITGAGQRDRAYTWTASAYLLLAAADHARRVGLAESPP